VRWAERILGCSERDDAGGCADGASAPTNLTRRWVSSTQVNLSWTAPSSGSTPTGYQLERCQGAGCTTLRRCRRRLHELQRQWADGVDVVLVPGAATSAAGPSGYSAVASATTQAAAPKAPSARRILTATAASSTQVNLSWTAPEQWRTPTGYQLERCQGAGCTTFAALPAPTGTSYSDSGLTASTSYSYRVLATSAAGRADIGVASATTQAAAPPPPPPPPSPARYVCAAQRGQCAVGVRCRACR